MAPFPRREQASNNNSEPLGVKLTIVKKKVINAFKHNAISKKFSEYKQNVSHYISNSVLLKLIRHFCNYFLNSKQLPCRSDATDGRQSDSVSEFTMKLRNGTRTTKIKLIHSSSNSAGIQKNPREKLKTKEREKACICMPQRLSPVEVPSIWSEFRENSQLCDGVIICEDGMEIKVHRVFLSSVSSYFKAHFTNSLNRGSPENTEAKVNVPSHIFMKLLDFAYTGQCIIDGDTVEDLLRVADQYHVLGVIQLCCRYILDQLQPTNCLGILRFARYYFCSDLEREGKRYVRHNFVKLLNEGGEFNNLTVEEVIEILEDDELNVRNEEVVYDAVRRWICVNPRKRKIHLLPLLKCVRLGSLSVKFLTENVMTWSIVTENQECQKYLIDLIEIMDTARREGVDIEKIDNELWRPRVPYDILFVIGGWSEGSPTNFIETYDARADRWLLSVDTDNVIRAYHGSCALNGYIYVIGGSDGDETFNTFRCFDPINHKWTECAFMYYPRCFVSVVMHDNKIYAMGGQRGYIGRMMRMSSVERYDPRCNQWELIKPMQRQRAGAGAAVLNDKIYIVGGFNGHEVMSSAEVYDTLADQWTFIPHMLSPRAGVALVAFKNTLYALGGYNSFNELSSSEKFTPGASHGWESIKDMFSHRSNFATVVLDDLIFVIGGFYDSTPVSYVKCYDTDANKWTDASSMNLTRAALSACILSGLPNARDYSFLERGLKEVGQGAGLHQDIPLD